MRNLKRALSLALASVMLLGMMVIGTSAAGTNFADDADIVNSEAAAITAGLGIFAGSDGKFLPNETVTRAQMATIVVKMLYGSDVNADIYKGIGKFTDVANYQGGWAEGYINLCESLGIVSGYGDNTFKPGNPVTTAEAATMILNALAVDAGAGTWPATVMAKSDEIGLFGELSLATNAGLTRDNLAVLVLEGLKYSPKGETTVYTVTVGGVETKFSTASEAYFYQQATGGSLTAQTTSAGSLADTVFKLQSATGVLTNNAANDATYAADAANDVKATSLIGGVSYVADTGLDLIGHTVTVYYKVVKGEKVAYAVVDKSKEVKVASAKNDQTAAQVKALLGLAAVPTTGANIAIANTVANYAVSGAASIAWDGAKFDVAAATYIVTDGVVTAKKTTTSDIDVLTVTVTNADKGYYTVSDGVNTIVAVTGTAANNVDKDLNNIDWLALVKKDETTASVPFKVTAINTNEFYSIEAVKTVTGKVSLIGTKITVNGTAYSVLADTTSAAAIANSFTAMDSTTLDFTNEFTFYLDEAGKIFAAVKVTNADTNDYAPVYVIGTTRVAAGTNAYGATSYNYNIQYYTLDGAVNMAVFASSEGLTIAEAAATGKVAYETAKITAPGWYLLATTEKGAAVKALNSSTYVDGYKLVDYTVTGSALNLTASSTNVNGNLINAKSTFLYSTVASVASSNKAATVKVGAHASDSIAVDKTFKMVVAKNASNAAKVDIVAAWVNQAVASSTKEDIVYVSAYNGQLSKGTTPTYSYTVYKLDGTKEDIVVTTANTTAQTAQFKQVVKAANGSLSFAAPTEGNSFRTQAGASVAKSAYYTIDGTNYLTISGTDYVVNGAVVVDLRTTAQKATIPAISSVIGLLDQGVTFTAVYKTATVSGNTVKTISTIVITANA